MGRQKKKKKRASKASKNVSQSSKVSSNNIMKALIFLAIGAAVWINTFTTSTNNDLVVHFVSNGASSSEYLKTSNSHLLKCSTQEETNVFDFNKYHYYMPNGKRISVESDVCTSTTTTLHVTRVPKSQHYVWPAPQTGHITNVSLQDGTNVRPSHSTNTSHKNTHTHTQVQLEVLASSPRILYIHNFLSESEANDLIAYAQSDANPYKMAPSTTGTEMWNHMSEEKRKKAVSSQRTSTNAFVLSTPTAKRLKRRAFDLLNLKYDEQMADGIQVLRYDRKQACVIITRI